MCLLDPLLVDFPPIKGCNEVYADKKQPQKGEISPLDGRRRQLCCLFVQMCSPLYILKIKIGSLLRFLENPGQFQGCLGD